MLPFDSPDYWISNHWDRDLAIERAPSVVGDTWIAQEEATLTAVAEVLAGLEHQQCQVLDLPCGTGRLAALMLARFGERIHVTGVDLNVQTLSLATRRVGDNASNWSTLCIDAYTIGQQRPGQFHVVVSLEFLHHVADVPRMIQAVHDCLRPNGHFIGDVLASEKHRAWERAKRGIRGAAWRELRFNVGTFLYNRFPATRSLVKTTGLARLAPLSEPELRRFLTPAFENVSLRSDFYHWFRGVKR